MTDKEFNEMTPTQLLDNLHEVIDSVKRKERYTPLCEMSIRRKDFKKDLKGLGIEILAHWCLVRYAVLTGCKKYRKHWSDELYGFITNVQSDEIKENNSYNTRYKVIYEVWETYNFFDQGSIEGKIAGTLRKENISRSSQAMLQAIDDCARAQNGIISLLASFERYDLTSAYVDELARIGELTDE